MLIIHNNQILLNTELSNPYFDKVLKFKDLWYSNQDFFPIKTSGSTGTPKEILLTRKQLIASAKLTGKTFNLKKNDAALCCLDVDYIAGMMMLVRGFVLNLRMTVIEPSSNPFWTVNSQREVLLEQEKNEDERHELKRKELSLLKEDMAINKKLLKHYREKTLTKEIENECFKQQKNLKKREIELIDRILAIEKKIEHYNKEVFQKEITSIKEMQMIFSQKHLSAFVPLQLQNIIDTLAADARPSVPYLSLIQSSFDDVILLGGAAVSESLLEKIQKIKVPVYATYGMTETVTHVAIKRLNGVNKQGYFTVLEGVEIVIDERNCLKIKSETTNNEWITTNDIVELIDNNHFNLIGRFDNVINSGGVKIQLEKVEKTIEVELQKVQIDSGTPTDRFFAYGINDEKLGQKLILVIETEQSIQDKESLFKNLPKFERPKEVYYLKKFIETPTGKIDKNKTVNEFILHKVPNR